MNEIVELIMGLLCPGSSLSDCQRFVSGYEEPMLQLLWLVFFPMIFITFLVVILSSAVTSEHGKFKVLVGIGAIMFIIVQGYWQFVLTVSKMWWFAIIVLGGLWAFTKKMGVGGHGGGAGETKNSNPGWLRTAVLGRQVLDPRNRAANTKLTGGRMHLVDQQMKELKHEMSGMSDREKEPYAAQLAALSMEKKELEKRRRLGLPPD